MPDNLNVVRLAETSASWDAFHTVDVSVVGAQDVLRLVAPTVLASFLVGMIRSADLAGDIDGLAAKMHAGRGGNGSLLVVVLLESHR